MDSIADTQAQYALIGTTLDALEGGLYDTRTQGRHALKQWIATVRANGLPALAYELEQIDAAIERANVAQIADSLVRAGRQTADAANQTEGMMQTQLQQLAAQLLASGQELKTSMAASQA